MIDRGKVLIVDDNPQNRALAVGILEDDFELFEAVGGYQCLDMVPKIWPDVILLDIMMPDLDGIETLYQLRSMPGTQNIRVVMCTIKNQDKDMIEAFKAGANNYIIKPIVDIEKVLISVKRQYEDKQRLDKLESDLQQAQKMEAMGTLAGGIAHDFNNILFPIVGYAEMILEEIDKKKVEFNYCKEILVAARRAGDLVKQILTFSRQTRQEPIPMEMSLIVNEVLKFLDHSLPSTIKIEKWIQKDCGMIIADPTQIHQIIMNLCTNAKHAMEEVGGVLEVRLEPHIFDHNENIIGLNQDQQYLKLSVSDTGCGIPEKVVPRIFDPFFTTKNIGKGTGMGLSVVHCIVTELNGVITVDSKEGDGTSFRIYFPILNKTCTRKEIAQVDNIPKGDGKILVVDDEKAIADMLEKMLSDLGYQVRALTSSKKALKLLLMPASEINDFDLVITDMTMPELTGVGLAKKVMEKRPEMPFILVTGYSELIDAEQAKEIGIKDFLYKPLLREDLALSIKKILSKKIEP